MCVMKNICLKQIIRSEATKIILSFFTDLSAFSKHLSLLNEWLLPKNTRWSFHEQNQILNEHSSVKSYQEKH